MSRLPQPYLDQNEIPRTREYRFPRSWSEANGPHSSCRREDFEPSVKASSGWYVSLMVFLLVCYLSGLAVMLIVRI